jgi:thiol-disulfide isomerase/thioredoxin
MISRSMLAALLLVSCTSEPAPEDEPGPVDSDGDGLLDPDEEALGTDPTLADTDGDGVDDGTEVTIDGTNPRNPNSVVFIGGYHVLDIAPEDLPTTSGPSTAAYQLGDTFENFSFVDSYGEKVPLWAFYGSYVYISVGAEWCVPCKNAAALLPYELELFEGLDVVGVEIVYEDNAGVIADIAVLERWRDEAELAPALAPVVTFHPDSYASESEYRTRVGTLDHNGSIPSMWLLSPEMIVLAADDNDAMTTLRHLLLD